MWVPPGKPHNLFLDVFACPNVRSSLGRISKNRMYYVMNKLCRIILVERSKGNHV